MCVDFSLSTRFERGDVRGYVSSLSLLGCKRVGLALPSISFSRGRTFSRMFTGIGSSVFTDVLAGGCSGNRRGPYVVGLVNSGSFPPGRTGESKPAVEGSTRASWHAHRGPTLSYGSPRDYKLPGRGSRPIIRKPNGLINHLARVHSCNHCTKVLRARLRCML